MSRDLRQRLWLKAELFELGRAEVVPEAAGANTLPGEVGVEDSAQDVATWGKEEDRGTRHRLR